MCLAVTNASAQPSATVVDRQVHSSPLPRTPYSQEATATMHVHVRGLLSCKSPGNHATLACEADFHEKPASHGFGDTHMP